MNDPMPPESLPPESDPFTAALPPAVPPADAASQPNRNQRHQSDELIAIVVALLGIGTILFWVLGKNNPIVRNFSFGGAVPENSEGGDVVTRFTAPNSAPATTPDVAVNGDLSEASASLPDNDRSPGSQVQNTDNPTLNVLTDRRADGASRIVAAGSAGRIAAAGGAGSVAAIATQRNDATGESANQGNTQSNAPVSQPTAETVEADALPPATAPRQFSDVAATSPLAPYVNALSSRGVLDQFDDGTLNPNAPISRAEFAQLVSQAFGKPRINPAINFKDVSVGSVNQAAIEEATRTGFMTGFPDNSFKPNLQIPRYQMQVALVTGTQLQPSGDPVQALSKYTDRNAIPSWAIPKVAAAVNAGILPSIEPTGTTLNPAKVATRGEAIVMLHSALVEEGKLPAVK